MYLSTAPAPLPRRERRKDARPGELLEAALDLFVEKGFAATRVEEVAARAGVSKGTLFLYFPSKIALFNAVVQFSISGRFAEWNEELRLFEGSSHELLRRCYEAWWEHIGSTKSSGITSLVFGEARHFPEITEFYHREVTLPGHDLVARIVQRGIDRGEFRAVPLGTIVHVLFAPMMFLVMWRFCMQGTVVDNPPLSPEQYIATQVDMLLHGLCSPAPVPCLAS